MQGGTVTQVYEQYVTDPDPYVSGPPLDFYIFVAGCL
jgi:hypothetical protein